MEPTSIADAEARALADAYMEDARHIGVAHVIYTKKKQSRFGVRLDF